MSSHFELIRDLYSEGHKRYGDSSAALLTPKGRHEFRFRPVVEALLANAHVSVLDYGCGLGFLCEFLREHGLSVDYTGVDMTPSFIKSCRERLGAYGQFELVGPQTKLSGKFDVVVCSGVFNLATSDDVQESLLYVQSRLCDLIDVTNHLLICDFLSPFVEFRQPRAQHIDIDVVSGWFVEMGLRRFHIRHDLLPYEYTLIVYKDSEILRPENIFKSTRSILSS